MVLNLPFTPPLRFHREAYFVERRELFCVLLESIFG